jgi:hypothetical protein
VNGEAIELASLSRDVISLWRVIKSFFTYCFINRKPIHLTSSSRNRTIPTFLIWKISVNIICIIALYYFLFWNNVLPDCFLNVLVRLILLFVRCIYIQDTFSQITILNFSFVLLHVKFTYAEKYLKGANARTFATQLNMYIQVECICSSQELATCFLPILWLSCSNYFSIIRHIRACLTIFVKVCHSIS